MAPIPVTRERINYPAYLPLTLSFIDLYWYGHRQSHALLLVFI